MTSHSITDESMTRILEQSRTVAVVGLSPREERDSNRVARYLQASGYRVIPVNPRADEILGARCYPTLEAIPQPVDLVDVFRQPRDVPAVAEDALRKGVRFFWLQLGIAHPESEERLRSAGIEVVSDRCTLVEHGRLLGASTLPFPSG